MTDDNEGIEWWNGLYERERRYWLSRADSARPVDAWHAYQRAQAQDLAAAEDPLQEWQRLGGADPEP